MTRKAVGQNLTGTGFPGRVLIIWRKPVCRTRSRQALGFNIVGFGCTTCIGNSGPLKQEIE